MMKALICLAVVLMLSLGEPVRGNLPPTSTPPPGNSLMKSVHTVSAYKVFSCWDGAWSCAKVSAGLVDPETKHALGHYAAVVNGSGEVGTWTFFNSLGDTLEGGGKTSSVTGMPVGPSAQEKFTGIPGTLYQAAAHESEGAAATVSYVQATNVVGGEEPAPEKCSAATGNHAVTVPYSAEYCLWRQDAVPAAVPKALEASGRMVEGFFGEGTVEYCYDGSKWAETARNGTLYSQPGSASIGTFWLVDGVEGWQIDDPNGYVLHGHQISKTKSPDSYPWSLSKVSAQSSPSSVLGPITNIQLLSTRGGVPPTSAPDMNESSVVQPYNVPFTAIFWFYTSE